MNSPSDGSDAVSSPIIAFFDVDNTLMRGASMYHLGTGAFRRGYVTMRDLMDFAVKQAHFLFRGENMKHLHSLRERGLAIADGLSVSEIKQLAEEIFDKRIERRLWPETVGLAHEHLAKGHQVWLITASPTLVAEVIARRLGLTGALGTDLVEEDGVLTGELDGIFLHGEGKAIAAKQLADEVGADTDDCWAYSDSRNDLPLLQLAGNRVVVNPDVVLRHHANSNGWPIMRLSRKSIRAARKRVRREAKVAKGTKPADGD